MIFGVSTFAKAESQGIDRIDIKIGVLQGASSLTSQAGALQALQARSEDDRFFELANTTDQADRVVSYIAKARMS